MSGMAVPHSVALLALTTPDTLARPSPARPGASGFGTLVRLAAAADTGRAVAAPEALAAVAPDASGATALVDDKVPDARPCAEPLPACAGLSTPPHDQAPVQEAPSHQDEPLQQTDGAPVAGAQGPATAPAFRGGPDRPAIAPAAAGAPLSSARRAAPAVAVRHAARAVPTAAAAAGGGPDAPTPVPPAPATLAALARPMVVVPAALVSVPFHRRGAAVPVPIQVTVPATGFSVKAAPPAAPASKAKVQAGPGEARPVGPAASPAPYTPAATVPAYRAAFAASAAAPSPPNPTLAAAGRTTRAAPAEAAPDQLPLPAVSQPAAAAKAALQPTPVAQPAAAWPASIAPVISPGHSPSAQAQPVATPVLGQTLAARSFAATAPLIPPVAAPPSAPALDEQTSPNRGPVLRDAGVLWPAIGQRSDRTPGGRLGGTPPAAAPAPIQATGESRTQPAAVRLSPSPLPPLLAGALAEAKTPVGYLRPAVVGMTSEPIAQVATSDLRMAAVFVAEAPGAAAPILAGLASPAGAGRRINHAPADKIAADTPVASAESAAPPARSVEVSLPAGAPADAVAPSVAASAVANAPQRMAAAEPPTVRSAAIQPVPHPSATPQETPVAARPPVVAETLALLPAEPAEASRPLAPSATVRVETTASNAAEVLDLAVPPLPASARAPGQADTPQQQSPVHNQQAALPRNQPAPGSAYSPAAAPSVAPSAAAAAQVPPAAAIPIAQAAGPILIASKAGVPQPTTATGRAPAPAVTSARVGLPAAFAVPEASADAATAPPAVAAPLPAPAGQIEGAGSTLATRKPEAAQQVPAPDATLAPAAPFTHQDRLRAPSAVTGAPVDAAASPATAPPTQGVADFTGLQASQALPAAATTGMPASAPAAAPSAAAAPATQIAQAAGSILIDTRGAGAVTVHLQPAELGAVSIRIGKTTDGAATVDVTADRSTTLAALQADLGHLHQALDRAGVSDNRTLTLHLGAAPDAGSGGNAAGGRNPAGDQPSAFASSSGWQGSGSGQGGGNAAGGQQGQSRPQTSAAPEPPWQPEAAVAAASSLSVQARAGRSAVNITA